MPFGVIEFSCTPAGGTVSVLKRFPVRNDKNQGLALGPDTMGQNYAEFKLNPIL